MKKGHLHNLLERYFSGSINKEELRELEKLLSITDDEDLSAFLADFWDEFQVQDEPDPSVINNMFQKIEKRTKKSSYQLVRKLLRVAAIILLPLLGAFSTYLFLNEKAICDPHDHTIRMLTEKGQQASVILSDGTYIRLNAESSLSYKQNFGIKDRQVYMTGEAFFEVTKDTMKPFTVSTESFDIEVLGTSFNVYAYEKEDIAEISLVSGHVKATSHLSSGRTTFLQANEKIIYDKNTSKVTVKETDNRFETAWLAGALIFRSVLMKDVIYKLERKYGVKIHAENVTFHEDLFTGSFNNESIIDVLHILQTHYSFSYRIIGNDVYVFERH